MGPIIAAVGAAIAAVMEVTVASRIHLADAQPQIVLAIAILLTLIIGFEEGMIWAFVGGLFVDFLTLRPIGTTVFSMLIIVGLATLISPFLGRVRVASPLIAVAILTPVFIVLSVVTTGLLGARTSTLRLSNLVAASVINVIFAAIVGPLFAAVRRRWEQQRRFSW